MASGEVLHAVQQREGKRQSLKYLVVALRVHGVMGTKWMQEVAGEQTGIQRSGFVSMGATRTRSCPLFDVRSCVGRRLTTYLIDRYPGKA
jgi:hypothetical protein